MNRTLTHCAATLGIALAAHAQTASYTPFGVGCNGGTTTHCLSLNATNPTMTVASLPNEYAYPVMNTTGVPIQVTGFDIFTVTNGTLPSETVNTGILYDLNGPGATAFSRPAPTNSANGKITVVNVQGWYSTTVYPPMTFQPGEVFWLHVDAYAKVAPPQHATTGGVAGPVSNWYRRPSNNMVWTASVSVARQIFRLHCLPATPTVPSLTATGLPQFGSTFTMQLAGGPAFSAGFLIWSLDRTQWLSMPTPVDLVSFGAPGCFVQTSTDSTVLVVLDGNGQGTTSMTIPTDPSFGGFTFYNQTAVLHPGANLLGLLVGNAATAVVGL